MTTRCFIGVVATGLLLCGEAGAQPYSTATSGDPAIADELRLTCCNKAIKRSANAPVCPKDALDVQDGAAGRVGARGIQAQQKKREAVAVADIKKAEKTCLGHPIAEVDLQGCIGTRCQSEARRRRFLSLLDLAIDKPLKAGQLALGRQRLLHTGFFQVPHVYCRIRYGKAKIAFKVKGNRFIRRIRFHRNEKVYGEDLQGRLIFQPGDVLDPLSPAGRDILQRQCSVLATLYTKRGHDDAVIHVRSRSTGIGLVAVDIAVDEGVKHRVSRYRVTIKDPAVPSSDERRLGLACEKVTKRDILRVSGLEGEDVFAGRLRVKARGKIRRYLRMLGYAKPRITIEHLDVEQLVKIGVKLGRCNVVRMMTRETTDSPFTPTSDEDLLGSMSFAESGVFDLDEAERSRRALRAMLENRGALFAQVRMDFRRVPRTTTGRIDTAVTYYITTRYAAQIRALRFPGLAHYKDEQIKAVIGTHAYDFFGQGGYLQINQMLADLSRLKSFYESEGFFEFRYKLRRGAASRFKGVFDRRHYTRGREEIWEYLLPDRGFKVRRPGGENFIYVEVPVEEGRRSRLTKLSIAGASRGHAARVRELMGLSKGSVISYRRLLEGVHAAERYYHDLGYFQMRFLLECWGRGYSGAGVAGLGRLGGDDKAGLKGKSSAAKAGPAADKGSNPLAGLVGKQPAKNLTPWEQGKSENRCRQARLLAEKVSLRLTVAEGKRVRMGEVFISGNFDTDDDILLRDLPRPGEPFSKPRLFDAQRMLRNTGLFDSVTFDYIGADEDPVRDRIAVLVRVVESRSKDLQFEAGFQTINAERQQQQSGGSSVVTTPAFVVDHIEHQTSAQQRLTTGYGTHMGVVLPSLLLTGGGSFVERNLWGQGHLLELRGQLGWTFDKIGPDLIIPELVNVGLTYFNRRLAGSDWSLRLIAPYFIRDYATITIDIDKIGAAAEVSKRFGRLAFTTGVDLAYVRTRELLLNEPFTDFSFQQKLIPRVTYDSTDSPLNPTRGAFLAVSAALINAQLFDTAGKSTGTGSFVKIDATGKWFKRFGGQWVLASMLRLGGAYHLATNTTSASDRKLPANERFRLGGALGVRGFSTGGIPQANPDGTTRGVDNADPVDYDPQGNQLPYKCAQKDSLDNCVAYQVANDGDVLVSGAIELRTPPVFFDSLRLAFFYDFGGISEDLGGLNAETIRTGTGVGLRWLFSGQIPVRLDVATPTETRCLDPGVKETAACENIEEPVQFHFGLLYAF